MKEREYLHPKQKFTVKFNYWNYIESFSKALLYENSNRKIMVYKNMLSCL